MMKKNRLLKVTTLMLPLLFFSLWSFGQTSTVRGLVTDEAGASMPGVTVVVKGTNNGTITDQNGSYSIAVPSGAKTLVFSFVGMTPQEIEIGGKTQINAVLKEDIIGLQEVVAIGYGNQRKEAVTGSVASMKGDDMRSMAASNITQALQGRVSGVQLEQTNSKPGSAMQIRIRGTRSLNANNDPLIVLDGIPFAGSIGDIDPNSIKSIDILKDASATAIYGSRGANGVILVSTNKGVAGQKAQVTYNGYYGLKDVYAKYPMMSGSEFAALRKYANTMPGGKQYTNTLDEADDVNTDWQDLLYKNGTVNSHDVGINGGTIGGSYTFGVSYYKEEAVVPLQDYSRYSIRSSADQEIGKYFRFGYSTNTNFSISNGNNLGAVGTALASSPIANIYNADGSLKERYQQVTSGAQWVSTRKSLEALGDKYIDQTRAFATYNALYSEVKIPGIDGLKYRINLGLNYRQNNAGNYTGVGVFSGTPSNNSVAAITNEHTINWTVENLLTYDRTFAEKHKINAVAMYSAEQTKYNKSNVSAKNIPAEALQFYNLGLVNNSTSDITVSPGNQDYKLRGLLSWMGRVMYSYDDRYMLSLTIRNDKSSVLAPGHQSHTYPAISAGWNIAKESFMSGIDQIDNLKLRVGYGQTSNQSVDPYKTLGLLSTRPYNFGTTYNTGVYVSELPNPVLGWEYSSTYNVGLDFGILKNRLSGTFEYYIQNTNNVLLSINLPSTSGVSSYMANIGETQNKGFELSLNGVILDNLNGWTWEAGVNVYANRNKLVALASGQEKDETNWWFVGHPIDVIYDYEKTGLWQDGDPYLTTLEPGGNVGMIKVKYTGEYKEDGTPSRAIAAADRQIISLEPDFLGGFNTRVAYKGIDLNIIGSFKSGGILNSTLYGSASYLNNMNSRSNNNVKVDYWTEDNRDAKYPRPNGLGGDNPKYGSTLGYFDASYLKIRTITLGYNLDSNKWFKKSGIDKMRIYCTVQNPIVFSPYTKESGMDPETNSYGDQNAATPYDTKTQLKRLLTIGTNTPSTRNYLIGINLTF
jgi:TonB-dependent starch-binding outer membrane protein SusC